jgi:hypothetical protein
MPKDPTPSDRAPQQSAPFSMPSPFPAPEADSEPPPRRGRAKVTIWTIVGIVLASAAQYFLNSHGVPAPVVDGAARAIHDALPK